MGRETQLARNDHNTVYDLRRMQWRRIALLTIYSLRRLERLRGFAPETVLISKYRYENQMTIVTPHG